MSKIIVNLKGGLGNQMFQYALGRSLALKNNDELKLDIRELKNGQNNSDTVRTFRLNEFNTVYEIADGEESDRLKHPNGYLSKIFKVFSTKILKKHHIGWEPEVLNLSGDIYLDGYWQSPKYFNNIRDTLLTDFTLARPLTEYGQKVAEHINSSLSVSIHIRRGDYIKNARVHREFGVCSAEYYKTAMTRIKKAYPTATYFVFSDDIAWVKENLFNEDDQIVFVSGPNITDCQELSLMSQCQHNIIANSSFSWWAAWLNQNPAKIVITPTPWFNNHKYDPTLIPDLWLQLPK